MLAKNEGMKVLLLTKPAITEGKSSMDSEVVRSLDPPGVHPPCIKVELPTKDEQMAHLVLSLAYSIPCLRSVVRDLIAVRRPNRVIYADK